MTDYDKIREELHEKHSESFKTLHISELKDQIAEKDEVIAALNHTVAEQQDKIVFLNRSHEALVSVINKREARIDQLEAALLSIAYDDDPNMSDSELIDHMALTAHNVLENK